MAGKRSWVQLVIFAERAGLLPVLAGTNQFCDLPDVAKVVHRPLMEHLLQGDLTGGFVMRAALADGSRQLPQIFHVNLALLPEKFERSMGVSVAVEVEVHLRVVWLELRHLLRHETIQPHPIAVTFGVGKVRQDLGHREPVGRRLPGSVLVGQFQHQSAHDRRCRLQQVEGIEAFFHGFCHGCCHSS